MVVFKMLNILLLPIPGSSKGQTTVTKQLAKHPTAYSFSFERAKNMVSDE
jgi:hypothetical protein